MGTFRAFPISPRRWGIEEVVPGEPPATLPFIGTAKEVENEVHRLNLFGATRDNVPLGSNRLSRSRDANKRRKRIVDPTQA